MGQKRQISSFSLFKSELLAPKLYTIRRRIASGIFWDHQQPCRLFRYRVIDEKRVKKWPAWFCRPDGFSNGRFHWWLSIWSNFGRHVIHDPLDALANLKKDSTFTFKENQWWIWNIQQTEFILHISFPINQFIRFQKSCITRERH